ncbi:MAG: transcription-repair coupling factor [Pirellulaceae bacterium]
MSGVTSELTAAMDHLVDVFSSTEGFSACVECLSQRGSISIDHVSGAARGLAIASLGRACNGTVVAVVESRAELDAVCDELSLFYPRVVDRLPAWESDPDENTLFDEVYGDRLRTLNRLVRRPQDVQILVASIQSFLQPLPHQSTFAESTRELAVGDNIDLATFIKWLVQHGYQNAIAVELPGEFAHRGGIIDIFPPDRTHPVRVELFGDELESLRSFEPETQRSITSLTAVEITVLRRPRDGQTMQLTEFLPADSWILLHDFPRLQTAAENFLAHRTSDMTVERLWQSVQRFGWGEMAPLALGGNDVTWQVPIDSVERFSGEVGRVTKELEQIAGDDQVNIVVENEAETKRLRELFDGSTVGSRIHYVEGRIRTGFRLTEDKTLVLSGHELFARSAPRRRGTRRLSKTIDSFIDLREGDLVVHLSHGIGRYRGLEYIDKGGQQTEHMAVEFADETKIYVPATRIHLIQKYVGGTKTRPRLAKVGGKAWVKHKRAAELAVVDVASEMIDVQAKRAARVGLQFAPDSEWQGEFDAAFPYRETPDQALAIHAIKDDMESLRPMDRLLCGDVGFGKTEVAMRAAFKAVESGYQVAMLVPTTILAEQHYHSFCERMSEFPIDVAKLSRFCTSAEQKEVVAGLKSGRVDIVIGTHRLASKDIDFNNIGLLIIDEEQRFGVAVKERLKHFRSSVDILTTTATPIPRTLHMALVGIRDISNLQTPPQDRLAVDTHVVRFSDELVRHAIVRELDRNGQVFFVHNRVHDIEQVKQRLMQIVPEARIRIGHAQMPEEKLESVMVDFIAHEFDILLATTIIESGLDIPNTNTIFVNEADRYGLSDLHQLRGRVGRYHHKAYCYLLLDSRQSITPNAARRLRAIEEFSEMGAGFSIAMRDLEIRGAGNLLGTQQSGHIAAVGYELYCQLLETAVRAAKMLPPKWTVDVEVDLPGEAYIPTPYVADMRLKIDLYRRLNRVCEPDEIKAFREELIDRFGPLPKPVIGLLERTELKVEAAVWQIVGVAKEENFLVFRYTSRERIEQFKELHGLDLRIADEQSAYFPLPAEVTNDQMVAVAKSVLRPASRSV